MRITTLALRNFRSHHETVLDLDRFNFVRGPNGCGKSSIQMALEYLFTGRCELTDAAGRGAETLIRAGAKEFEVSAILGSGDTIRRRRTFKSQTMEINGKRMPVEAGQGFLTRQIGPGEVLSVVLHAGRFADMPAAAQEKQLAQLVDLGRVEIPREILDALSALGEQPPLLRSDHDANTAQEHFLDLHREASRALESLGEPDEVEVVASPPGRSNQEIQLAALRRQKGWLVFQGADVNACRQNAGSTPDLAAMEFDDAFPEILSAREEEELNGPDRENGQDETLSQGKDRLACGEEGAVKMAATARNSSERCPACGQSIPISAVTGLLHPSRGAGDQEVLMENAREEIPVRRSPETNDSSSKFPPPNPGHGANPPEIHPAMIRPLGVAGNGGELRTAIPGGQPAETALRTEPIPPFGGGRARGDSNLREKEVLENRTALLGKISEFFGPGGAILKQAKARRKAFQDTLNRKLSEFGYTANFAAEPFEIRVIREASDGCGLPLRLLSSSERFRLGIAFQIALAEITGVRLVVIDGADVLDNARRKLLTALLMRSEIDQAIVLATGEGPAPTQIPSGVKFFSLAGAES